MQVFFLIYLAAAMFAFGFTAAVDNDLPEKDKTNIFLLMLNSLIWPFFLGVMVALHIGEKDDEKD